MSNVIWIEFAGHGYVLELNVDEVTAASWLDAAETIADVTLSFSLVTSYTGGYSMEAQVGSSVYVTTGLATELGVEEGYWTLVAADDSAGELTIRAPSDALPSIGAFGTARTLRIEDFYRFSSGIPDFVTGSEARERWYPIISEDGFSATIGQKIEVQGGVSSFDGITVTLNYRDDAPVRRILRTLVEVAVDEDGKVMVANDSSGAGSSVLTKFATSAPAAIYANNQADFGFEPVLVDREAVLLRTLGGASSPNRNLNCSRGLLNTRSRWVDKGSVLFAGLQTGLGAAVEIKKKAVDSTDFGGPLPANQGVFYSGIVEDLQLSSGVNTFELALSPEIFKSRKLGVADDIQQDVVLSLGEGEASGVRSLLGTYTTPTANPDSAYQWVKLGDIALQFRFAYPLLSPSRTPVVSIEESTSGEGVSFDTTLYIDHIVLVDLPSQNDFNDNGVIIGRASTREQYLDSGRLTGPSRRGSYYERPSLAFDRDGTLTLTTDGRSAIYQLDRERYTSDTSTAELCHVFVPQVDAPTVADYDASKTVLTQSFTSPISCAELILQVLCSDYGDEANGPFDVLPFGLGIGTDQRRVNYASFGFNQTTGSFDYEGLDSITSSKLQHRFINAFIQPEDSEKIDEWLTKNILSPLNLVLFQDNTGRAAIGDSSNVFVELDTAEISEDDIQLDTGTTSLSFTELVESGKIFDRVILTQEANWADPQGASFSRTDSIIPGLGVGTGLEDVDGEPILGSYPDLFGFITTIPIRVQNKFASNTNDVIRYQGIFASIFARPQPEIEFVASADIAEINDKPVITVSSVINENGSRGVDQVVKIIDKKVDVLSNQARYRGILVNASNEARRLWAASAETVVQIVTNPIEVAENRYTSLSGVNDGLSAEEDVEGFRVGDEVLLYSEYFELLSVDGVGAPDPREVISIDTVTNEIELDAPFTDSAGVDVPLSSTRIIMHAAKASQTSITQLFLAFFNDGQSTYL